MSENAASKRQIMANKGNKEEFLDSLDHDSGFRSKDDITGSFRSSFDDTKRSSTESGAASSIDLQSPECLSFGSIHDADLAIDHLRTNKSPQKRRHGNENRFSPKAKCVREISAKLVLKEKSRSENIIASTPKRANLWGKFSSFLPSREVFGSLDQEEIPKQANTFQIPKAPTLASLGKSHNSFNSEAFDSFDFSNFDNTDQTGDSKHNNLFTAAICDDFESKISGSAALDQILESSVHDPVKILPAKKIHGSRASSSFIPNKLEVIEEISPAKDKVVMPRRKYDILGNLPGENHLCLDIIMAKLPDPDILSMCMVSKLWNKIVMNNKKASARRLQYLKDREASKENKLGSQAEKKGDDVKVVKAFNLCSGNVDSSIKYKSPPVSPSKRKFHENQKIVGKTSPSTKLMKCPTCDRPALVKSTKLRARRQTSFKRKLKRKLKRGDSTFQKQDSLKQTLTLNDSTSSSGSAASENSSPGSPGSPTSDMDDSGCVAGQQTRKDYEFAVCQTCHFKFCIKCKLENHPSKQCNFTPTTPPKQLNKSVACSKDSKKSLRRL